MTRRQLRALRRGLAGLLLVTAPLWVLALDRMLPEVLGLVHVAPDVLTAAVVAAAWTRPPAAAVAFAACAGGLADVPSGTPWGLEAARLAFVAATVASLRGQLDLDVPGARLLLLAGAAALERGLAVASLAVYAPNAAVLPLLDRSWQIVLATTLLGPVAFGVAACLHGETEEGR